MFTAVEAYRLAYKLRSVIEPGETGSVGMVPVARIPLPRNVRLYFLNNSR